MKPFDLKVVTPDGICFEGEVLSVVLRSVCGDVCILAGHADYVTTIDVGRVKIKKENEELTAACAGGFISVMDGTAKLVATTFEFSDEIDVARAERAKERAQQRIDAAKSDKDAKIAEMKLKRALNRLSVSQIK